MPDDILSALEDILFIAFLKRVVVMDDIGHAVRVSSVGHNPDMALKNHDISTLPLLQIRQIGRQTKGSVGKIHL